MNIISCFPFAEFYELNVLLVKCVVEDAGVSEWVINENDYTWMGDYKGFNLTNLLNEDRRFDPYRHKMTVITGSATRDKSTIVNEDENFVKISWKQRDFGTPYILEKYSDDNNWIIHADVDEAYDFQGNDRTQRIFDSLKKYADKPVSFPTRKYWYDFDNYGFTYYFHNLIPMYLLRMYGKIMGPEINTGRLVRVFDITKQEFGVFEYTFCFKPEHMKRKLDIWGHFPYTQEDLDIALKCNKKMQRSQLGEVSPQFPTANLPDNQWFEKIEINEDNTPKYVLEHFDELRTDAVDPDYKENRKKYFPNFYK